MKTDHDRMLDIDPYMILLGLGYAASLCVAIGWVATFVI
jgi:hypothetical protein